MKIAGVASALPQHKYDQRVLLSALQKHWGPKVDNPAFLERLQARVGVETRHLALPLRTITGSRGGAPRTTIGSTSRRSWAERPVLRSVARGVRYARFRRDVFVSVTGISSPSIDARLVNRMKLPVNIKRVPIFGLGCVAGAAGIARAADYVRAYPNQVAALLSVELCSLTLQQEDVSIANIFLQAFSAMARQRCLVPGDEREATALRSWPHGPYFIPIPSSDGLGHFRKRLPHRLSREVPEVIREHLARTSTHFSKSRAFRAPTSGRG